ncbi:alpha/beta hydrolase [Sphingomonas lycopersici]|uniref:Alpha/beta hydrolase n=1 Tax=Sphingomonas lycopersici TaxID=2951807 RepID=A0AA41ZDB9_9SPHN|nr:alpha/beta hydrolase [Sphingomonas lycopersici]MCW6533638.1 alpha/beta hydrolase [Sphingomonas lycopersici]
MSTGDAALLIVTAGDLPQADRHELRLDVGERTGKWAAQLDAALIDLAQPVIVVAAELAAIAFAHWAQLSPLRYSRQIAGAVLLDPAAPREWPRLGLASTPATPLPFPSLLVASGMGTAAHILALAARWRSRFATRDAIQNDIAGDSVEASLRAALRAFLAPHAPSAPTLRRSIAELTPPLASLLFKSPPIR